VATVFGRLPAVAAFFFVSRPCTQRRRNSIDATVGDFASVAMTVGRLWRRVTARSH
jgi:hypothetical protein